jgi:ribosomal protein S18 acetylase RimI-like enzyme
VARKAWYLWDAERERFVRAPYPPRDERRADALKRVKIRLADGQDRRKLLAFKREALETEPEIWLPSERDLKRAEQSLERWSPEAYPNNFLAVAEFDQKIIGLLLLVIHYHPNRGPRARIEDLFVLKDFRGYGIASRLLEFAKRLAEERGCEELNLIVGLRNPPALRLYKKQGFHINKMVALASLELGRIGGNTIG